MVGVLGSATALAANYSTAAVKIVQITNWVGTSNSPNEVLLIKSNEQQLVNPASCGVATSYYLDAASNVSRALILTALTTQRNFYLLISGGGCSPDNRPIIVAVTME